MLPKDAKKELERILSLDPHELTDGDIGFLRARRMYLNDEQQERFSEFLEGLPEAGEVAKSLYEMKRDELNTILTQIGLNPADYNNKQDAINAIETSPRRKIKPDTSFQKPDWDKKKEKRDTDLEF